LAPSVWERGVRIPKKSSRQKPLTQWHPSFFASLQLELQDFQEYLEYYDEINLNNIPRRIDVIIVVVRDNVTITRNIAGIFRKHNIFEYKSPDDTLSINDYYNGLSYALQYKAIEKNAISIDELTLSFVCYKKPLKLFAYLSGRYGVQRAEKGIYIVGGNQVPVQIIVCGELSESGNLFLHGLRVPPGTQSRRIRLIFFCLTRQRKEAYS
jgi:hypothetical protein